MSVITAQGETDFNFYNGYAVPEARAEASAQSVQLDKIVEITFYDLYSPRTHNIGLLSMHIRRIMKEKEGYASLSHLSDKLDIDKERLEDFLAESDKYKKSFIVKDNGDPVYRLDRSFGFMIDAWKTFCHLNALKY